MTLWELPFFRRRPLPSPAQMRTNAGGVEEMAQHMHEANMAMTYIYNNIPLVFMIMWAIFMIDWVLYALNGLRYPPQIFGERWTPFE